MSSDLTPLLIGFATVGLFLILIGMTLTMRRLFQRARLRGRRHAFQSGEGWATDHEWVYRPRAQRERQEEPPESASPAEASSSEAGLDLKDTHGGLDEAHREAEELLAAAKRQSEELLQASEAEARHRAGTITEIAQRQAQERLDEAEVEARRVVTAAIREHARLLEELARERAVVEETRTRLSSFLVDVLEEVESVPATGEPPGNVRDLNEARGVRTSAGGDP
jgi:F0F1-type ATP synthase membrane subunit b/b'